MLNKKNIILSENQVQLVGSYSSFFGFLLIATILFYRNIFDQTLELINVKFNIEITYLIFFSLLGIFAIIFLIIPNTIVFREIINNFKQKYYHFAYILLYILIIYNLTTIIQFYYTYLDYQNMS